MKRGKCPKCGSDEVRSGAHLSPKIGPFTSNSIPVNFFSLAALDNYVCTKCGYLERYIAETAKLEEIARTWKKIE